MIEYVDNDKLIQSEFNPRIWNEQIIEKTGESFDRFGFIQPIIVNNAPGREMVVIGGNLRLEVARKKGIKKIPVTFVYIKEIEREKELCLRLNRAAEWDYEKLGQNFSIDLLLEVGFTELDFSNMYNDVLEVENDEFDEQKEIEKIKVPKAKLGDLYQLGPHRILCGDSTKAEDVAKLMGNEKAAMIYCDPIYNISVNYDKGLSGKKAYGGKKTKDNKNDKEYAEFLRKSMEHALAFAQKNCHFFYWCDQSYLWLIQELYRELGIDFRRICFWLKNCPNPTPQIAFNKAVEPVVYGTVGKPYLAKNLNSFHEVLNKEVSNGNRISDDVLDMLELWLVKKLPTLKYEHATSKPPALHERPLRRCTKPGDLILDLFGGSASTMIACEQLKRKAYLCEIEPIFIDLTLKRYENLTGLKAKKLN